MPKTISILRQNEKLLGDLRDLIPEACQNVARTINSALVLLYWKVGERIRKDIVPDFDQWPGSWMGTKSDFEYGKKVLPFMGKFIKYLIGQNLSRKTLKEYIDNLCLLGGTIIRDVSIYEEHQANMLEVILEAVQADGCLADGYDCMSKSELGSFKKMCRKFEEFLKNIAEGSQR